MPRMLGNLDELLERIEASIQSEVQDTHERKRKRVERILDQAEEEAQRIKEETLQQAKSRAERRKAALRAEFRRKKKAARLRELGSDLDEAWHRAESELRQLTETDEYQDILRRLAQQAVQLMGPGAYRLAADERGQPLLTRETLDDWEQSFEEGLEGQVDLYQADEPAAIWGGLIVEDQERPRRVDASFSARLAIARDEIGNELFDRIESVS